MYVTLPGGSYVYVAESHSLKFINNKDLRKATGGQSFVADAALNIVYVADLGKRGMKEGDEIKDSDLFMTYSDAAFHCPEYLPLLCIGKPRLRCKRISSGRRLLQQILD